MNTISLFSALFFFTLSNLCFSAQPGEGDEEIRVNQSAARKVRVYLQTPSFNLVLNHNTCRSERGMWVVPSLGEMELCENLRGSIDSITFIPDASGVYAVHKKLWGSSDVIPLFNENGQPVSVSRLPNVGDLRRILAQIQGVLFDEVVLKTTSGKALDDGAEVATKNIWGDGYETLTLAVNINLPNRSWN